MGFSVFDRIKELGLRNVTPPGTFVGAGPGAAVGVADELKVAGAGKTPSEAVGGAGARAGKVKLGALAGVAAGAAAGSPPAGDKSADQ